MECPAARDEFSYRYTNEPRQHLGDEDHLTHLAVDACAVICTAALDFQLKEKKKWIYPYDKLIMAGGNRM